MARKGIYVEMAHHPQAIVDAMAGMEEAVDRAIERQKLFRIVGAVVAGLGLAGFFLGIFLQGPTDGNSGLVAFLSLPLFAVGLILLKVADRRRIPFFREHFDATSQILHTLRDDTGRKGRVVGWLDLSGPQQKEKTVRTARSGGGKRKVYYRDPWFNAKFRLVDGSLLRLTLEDKVKTKAGVIVRHQTQFSAKLVVNPDLYHLGEVPKGAIPVKSATLTHEDGILVLKGAGTAKSFSAQRVLALLKSMYSQILDVENPQPVFDRLRDVAEEARQAQEAQRQQATARSAQHLADFAEELRRRGFEPSPRSDRLFYNPQIPDTRFALAKRVIRLERKHRRRQRWERERSFSIARETDLALEAADAMLASSEISG